MNQDEEVKDSDIDADVQFAYLKTKGGEVFADACEDAEKGNYE